MKKILFVLFLFPSVTFGQAVISELIIGGNFQTGGIANFSPTKNAGVLYIVFVGVCNSSGTPGTVTLTGAGETWTELGAGGGALNTTAGKRVQAFRFYATSTLPSNTTTINLSGVQEGMWFNSYTITNTTVTGTNGSDAIVQVTTTADDATIQPSITMGALGARASVLTAWTNDVNPPTGTAESGWTITEDGGFNTPTTGGLVMKRENTSDNTPSWTAGALSNWAGIAIEFRASGRRAVIIN